MENNFGDPFDALLGLFETLIEDAPEMLQEVIHSHHKDEVHISAPWFLVQRLKEAHRRKYNVVPEHNSMFMGIEIIPSSDYALTLFHEDYPIYKEERMIHKISLDPLFVSKTGRNVTKYVMQIKGFIPGQIRKDSSLN